MPGASKNIHPMNATADPGLDAVIGLQKSTHTPVKLSARSSPRQMHSRDPASQKTAHRIPSKSSSAHGLGHVASRTNIVAKTATYTAATTRDINLNRSMLVDPTSGKSQTGYLPPQRIIGNLQRERNQITSLKLTGGADVGQKYFEKQKYSKKKCDKRPVRASVFYRHGR